jgi:asparagine synthase (glutamine-hydrolysing)
MATGTGPGERAGADAPAHRELLDRALDDVLAPWKVHHGPLVILFSGGVDSGLLAWELRDRPSTALATIGLRDAPDLLAAEAAARPVGLPWSGTIVSEADLGAALRRMSEELAGLPVSRQSIFLALAVAIDRAPAGDLLCGQGADELFLGYGHFRGVPVDVAAARAAADLDRLLHDDWPRTVRIAGRLGRRVHAPFLEPGFVRAALGIPVVDRMPRPVPKAYWRAWARSRGVPAELADRPKRALQFGTGVDAWLRRTHAR